MPNRRGSLPFFYKPWPGSRPGITKIDLRNLAFFATILAVIASAGWLYLRQASEVASYAHQIRELEREKEWLHREITALRAEVATLGSMERIARVGKELGYALPDAADAGRHLRIEYQLPPRPGVPSATWVEITTAVGQDAQGTRIQDARALRILENPGEHAQGLWQRLANQLKDWLEAPTDEENTP